MVLADYSRGKTSKKSYIESILGILEMARLNYYKARNEIKGVGKNIKTGKNYRGYHVWSEKINSNTSDDQINDTSAKSLHNELLSFVLD